MIPVILHLITEGTQHRHKTQSIGRTETVSSKRNNVESSIGTVNVCNRSIVQIELLKIVPRWIGLDFAVTRV